MQIERVIEKARVYVFEDHEGQVNFGTVLAAHRAAVEAADRFFREAVPLSHLSANSIDALNRAEALISEALKDPVELSK